MSLIFVRILISACLAGVLLFCIFGFMATFEPIDPSTQIKFRLLYGLAGGAVVAGLVAVWRKK